MSSSDNSDWGNKPLVVIIGLVASVIAIVVFFSGKQSVQEFLPNSTSTNTLNISLPECPADPAPTLYVTETPIPTNTPSPTSTPDPNSLGKVEVGSLQAVVVSECYLSDLIPDEQSVHFSNPSSDEIKSLPFLQVKESCVQTEPSSVSYRASIPTNSTWLWKYQSCSKNEIFASNVHFFGSDKCGLKDVTEYFVSQEYIDGENNCKTWTTKLTSGKDVVLLVQYKLLRDLHEAGTDLWFSPGVYEKKFLISVK